MLLDFEITMTGLDPIMESQNLNRGILIDTVLLVLDLPDDLRQRVISDRNKAQERLQQLRVKK